MPVTLTVAPGMGEPAAAAVAATSSTTGSLVMENVADPLVTEAPLTACRPLPVTKYTVEPAVIEGEDTVTVMAGNVPVTLFPFSKMPTPKVTMVLPAEEVTDEAVASVRTTCTGPVNAPAGTDTLIVAVPTVPAVNPAGPG